MSFSIQGYISNKYNLKHRICGPVFILFAKYLKLELMKGNNVDIPFFGTFYFKDAYISKVKYKKLCFKFHDKVYNLINNNIDFSIREKIIGNK